MKKSLTLQDLILRLQTYWAAKGCLLLQPINTEVGAGTMNPATFLRVLGPEPWSVGYVEPSVRPDDSRYGENPNRVQMHTQYQVILKPDPGNPQELYLESLESLGINRSEHDIRFVEDNWESPALNAWGLGWEVWVDGLEVTQYTYFQQAGGFALDPVAVEITYGLERIIMAIQGVTHFKDIIYAPGITYGEVLGQNEYEMSVYNLDEANVEHISQLFNIYEAEALALLEKGLPIPAYSYALKTSHTFNILDSRGVIGVTERARYFARMRDLARRAADLWVKRRNELGFPLGTISTPNVQPPPTPTWDSSKPQTFVLEIGSEELPADDVMLAIDQLRTRIPTLLSDLRLDYGEIEVEGTPRRLAVIVRDLAPRQRDGESIIKGPRTRIAFDERGQPTKAALGFARSQGVEVTMLEKSEIDGIEYVVAIVRENGKLAGEVLIAELPKLVGSLAFPRSMRWNWSNVAYSRPIRWLVALLGEQIVPFTYAGLVSGRTSRGLRNASTLTFDIPRAEDYKGLLIQNGIVLSVNERQNQIWAGVQELATNAGGYVSQDAHSDLLKEVANLVERPTPLMGTFDTEYLNLPREVLVTVMRKHQRYFPVDDNSGQLLPYFITAANGSVELDVVRAGNEAVLRARYADAAFFWKQDTTRPFESFRASLASLTFQDQLGSMLEKNERIEHLTGILAEQICQSDDERAIAHRAAYLAKADLVTQMVIEFTSLAGTMGREYALRSGERPEVAQAIYQHVLPRSAGDEVPTSRSAIAIAIADRLDSLVGLFAVGLAPKTNDIFALRRTALGLVQILVECNVELDLRHMIHAAGEVQPVPVSIEVEQEVLTFVQRRLEQWLLEQGERYDVTQAVLLARGHNPSLAVHTVHELARLVPTDRFQRILAAYSRPARIVRNQTIQVNVDPTLFQQPEEQDLWQIYLATREHVRSDIGVTEFLDTFEPLVEPINRFFEKVFVMVENETVRHNRLALLQHIAKLPEGIVNLTAIQGF